MVPGELQLTVDETTVGFEPPDTECDECGDTPGYSHTVEMTATAPETMTVDVTFLCDSCGGAVETSMATVPPPADVEDGPDGKQGALLEWIETYVEDEGRNPSKSTCVRSSPVDILEAEEVLDDLVADGWLVETDELRATNRITVYETQ
jgi:hypothetical protein